MMNVSRKIKSKPQNTEAHIMANSVTCLECTSDKLMHLSRVLLIMLYTCTNLMKCLCFKAQTNAIKNWPLLSKDPTLIWIRTLMKKRGC